MTAFDKKINQIATRHRWNIEKQARAAVPCYIIAAPTYEDAGKIVSVLNRCKGFLRMSLSLAPIYKPLAASSGRQFNDGRSLYIR